MLRSEHAALSEQEVTDALSCRIALGQDDLALIDWNAALLLGPEIEDLLPVLEYANVQLLVMRHLDDQLDEALEDAYELLYRRRWMFLRPSANLRRVALLQADAAITFEGLTHSVKLLGDQFMARFYRAVAGRFHLADWDASINRKLRTLDSIYQKLSDRQAHIRMEILEWIIILLIAVSIALPMLGFKL
jgi:hypothetical protein